jgi:hypothetical protein
MIKIKKLTVATLFELNYSPSAKYTESLLDIFVLKAINIISHYKIPLAIVSLADCDQYSCP